MSRSSLVLLLIALTAPLHAGDFFAFGARAGVPLTDAFDQFTTPGFSFENAIKRFTIGPSGEILLPFGLGFEADLLYRKTDMNVTRTDGDSSVTQEKSVSVWEIPLLAKFRFPGPVVKPYVSGGGSYRSFGTLPTLVTNLKDSGWGFVLGGGVEFKIKRVRISPEIRFTRWGSGQKSDNDTLLTFNRNQFDFLVGVTF